MPFEDQRASPAPNDILVIDDDPDIVRSLARILKTRGLTVRTATSGHEALKLAAQGSPAVVLTDIVMPGLNGIETARELRRACPGIVVIFMTGYSEMEGQAKEEGSAVVLTKPVDLAKLVELLKRLGFAT
jgi:CheY-like chemotaxis protein